MSDRGRDARILSISTSFPTNRHKVGVFIIKHKLMTNPLERKKEGGEGERERTRMPSAADGVHPTSKAIV